jgi:hypothetical protein
VLSVAPPLSLEERVRVYAEARLGRPLTDAEQHIDVIGADAALEGGKRKLAEAIQVEQARFGRSILRGNTDRIRVTYPIYRALYDLHLAGKEAARQEMRSMGLRPYDEPRALTEEDRLRVLGQIRTGLDQDLLAQLDRLQVKVSNTAVTATIGDYAFGAVARELAAVPGALDAASNLVSEAYSSGLAVTYENNQTLFAAWEYTAIMDGATCDVCRAWDGHVFKTLDAALAVMPGFGPNPSCFGRGRCRCRLVPQPPVEVPLDRIDFPSGPAVKPGTEKLHYRGFGAGDEFEYKGTVYRFESRKGNSVWATNQATGERVELSKHLTVRPLKPKPPTDLPDGTIPVEDVGNPLAAARLDRDISTTIATWSEPGGSLLGGTVPTRFADQMVDQVIAAGRWLDEEIVRRSPKLSKVIAAIKQRESDYREFEAAREGYEKARAAKKAILRYELFPDATTLTSNQNQILLARLAEDRDLTRLAREVSIARNMWTDSIRRVNLSEKEQVMERRRLLLEILEESGRKMGGELGEMTFGSDEVREALRVALAHLPREWIDQSNDNSVDLPLWLERSDERAHYRSYAQVNDEIEFNGERFPLGEAALLRSRGMRGVNDKTGERGDVSTAAHEFGHRMEDVRPILKRLEWAFYQRRTGNSSEPLKRLYEDKDEWAREDQFSQLYMGKDYGNKPISSFELLSMGLEEILFNTYRSDDEYRQFILGLLAIA